MRKNANNLSIILPVYNERSGIEKVLDEWKEEFQRYKVSYQFIICEDGSTDGTKELLEKTKKKYRLILNCRKKRRGYGGAVLDGLKTAKSKYILCIDSDGQCDPSDFSKFWNNKDNADVIIGWRTKRIDSFQRKLFSASFKIVWQLLFPSSIHDPSAPFVLFKKKTIISHLEYLSFLKEGFWWGFVGMCVKKKLSLLEIPIHHRPRFKGETQEYHLNKIPSIATRNLLGLVRLKFS